MSGATRSRISTRRLVLVGLGVCLLIAGVVSYYASSHPDGLEHVATSLGFEQAAKGSATADSPLAGYSVRGISDGRLSGGVAGVVGAVVVGLVMFGLARLVRRRGSDERGSGRWGPARAPTSTSRATRPSTGCPRTSSSSGS